MKRLIAISVFLSLALAPASSLALPAGPADAGVHATRLANGLRVVVMVDHAAPVVQTAVWYRFGSLDELPGRTGLAHALEHMLFRGTPNVSAGGLTDVIARLGAQMNGETSYDYTKFYFVMPADKLDVALYLDADRMAHAALRERDWQIERGAVLSEWDGDDTSPFFNLLERVRAAAYPHSAAGRTSLGVRNDVARATAADIARYYRAWYAPNNATLVVAGDVNYQTVFAKAQRYFGTIARKNVPARTSHSPVATSGAVVEAQFPFPFEVLDLAYAVPGDTEPGEPAISTLATLLQNERSPFYQALVQSNIALAIEANADTQLKGGLLHVFIILNPGHSGDAAQSIFQATMQRVLQEGFSDDLTTAAKRLTIADRTFSADSISGFGDLVGYTYGIVGERISDEDNRLANLSSHDLLVAAQRYLSRPTVVGHLRPSETPPKGSSQKNNAAATDDFSKREPNGPVTEPAWVRAAAAAPTTVRSKLHATEFRLSNGLRVIVQEKHDRPTFVLRGAIAASPGFVPADKAGLARLADSVADYGSARYPFAERRKTIDQLGAIVNAGSQFSARGMVQDFSQILDIVADGEMNPSFAEPWFSLQRDQLANGLQSEESISGVVIDHAYLRLLLAPGDPTLRFPSQLAVAALQQSDLLAYAKRYWRPDLTTIAVVGDVTPGQVRVAMERAFGAWSPQGSAPSVRKPGLPPAGGGHDYVGTAASEVYVRLGQPAVSRANSDYDAFSVLNQIFGAQGAFESRLWQELRQKRGLVYSVGSELSADSDRGDMRIELSASPSNVVGAIKLIRTQMQRLQHDPVSQAELLDAKVHLVNSALLSEESADGQAGELLDVASNGLPLDYYQTLSQRYARVSAADIRRVARTYLRPDKLIEIFAGPRGPWMYHGF